MDMISHPVSRTVGALCVALTLAMASGASRAAATSGSNDNGDEAARARHVSVVRILTGQFRVTEARAEHIVDAVERTAGKLRVPMSLILAIIQTESSFDPHATSSAGAIGLMQVMPATQRDTAPRTDIHDPDGNIYVGTSILRRYIDQAGGDMGAALNRYSGGTHGYARRVLARWHYFSDFADPGTPAPAHAATLVLRVTTAEPAAALAGPAIIRAASQSETSD